MRDSQTLRRSVVRIQASYQRKDALKPQQRLIYQVESAIRLGTQSFQKAGAHHVFHDVHDTGCSKLFVVPLRERGVEVQDLPLEIQTRAVAAHNNGHCIRMLAQLDPFSLADLHSIFSNHVRSRDVLLKTAYVTPHADVARPPDDEVSLAKRSLRYYSEPVGQLPCRQ